LWSTSKFSETPFTFFSLRFGLFFIFINNCFILNNLWNYIYIFLISSSIDFFHVIFGFYFLIAICFCLRWFLKLVLFYNFILLEFFFSYLIWSLFFFIAIFLPWFFF
jgi:hypothetical protein